MEDGGGGGGKGLEGSTLMDRLIGYELPPGWS